MDFLPTEGTLTFGASETNQAFGVTLLDDALIEGDEDFFIVLDQATGGVPIFTPEVRAIIRDSERNPVRVDPEFTPDWPIGRSYARDFAFPAVQPPDGNKLGDMVDPGPSRTFVFLDERVETLGESVFYLSEDGSLNKPGTAAFFDYPACAHNGAGSFSFADSHVESKKWLDPRTTPCFTNEPWWIPRKRIRL